MPDYIAFHQKWRDACDIYIIYILEAHFVEKDATTGAVTGGWPIGSQYNYRQTKTVEERAAMVQLLMSEFKGLEIPVWMDTPDNDFNNLYKPWPDRAFMFVDGKMAYLANLNDDGTRDCAWTTELDALLEGRATPVANEGR